MHQSPYIGIEKMKRGLWQRMYELGQSIKRKDGGIGRCWGDWKDHSFMKLLLSGGGLG